MKRFVMLIIGLLLINVSVAFSETAPSKVYVQQDQSSYANNDTSIGMVAEKASIALHLKKYTEGTIDTIGGFTLGNTLRFQFWGNTNAEYLKALIYTIKGEVISNGLTKQFTMVVYPSDTQATYKLSGDIDATGVIPTLYSMTQQAVTIKLKSMSLERYTVATTEKKEIFKTDLKLELTLDATHKNKIPVEFVVGLFVPKSSIKVELTNKVGISIPIFGINAPTQIRTNVYNTAGTIVKTIYSQKIESGLLRNFTVAETFELGDDIDYLYTEGYFDGAWQTFTGYHKHSWWTNCVEFVYSSLRIMVKLGSK
ncbi:MAG: hypothetical protein DKM50_01160 [Candidatus Margulisiibacteriota bacterium]|nr:MAG: hypothetical protein A2X43_13970 [Candidatus Margulisbacteria bacterium GWD2_39_127]OGI02279.1 MAG: hypothetical protein A2X42_13035 [Candidatus Margulisbacteria bacterium GWF2_38_17]OGI11529.1 MAG: hypothetical protein A2X41_02680 [Candidatus Margulisbacteria bacterium GWE2_39_32]PZM83832.1 MAG: hypothetical protein DKM50_01160 [Candidatus Margulisiibacteriota bacterium]HAR63753.1 hypothetical protein [Candidatus Margulisiibacteriota bacterium]